MLRTLHESSNALKNLWHKVAKRAIPPVSAREALCALLRRQVGVWGHAAFGGVFAAFSSGCARSKMAL
jgi:hypothetical protein